MWLALLTLLVALGWWIMPDLDGRQLTQSAGFVAYVWVVFKILTRL